MKLSLLIKTFTVVGFLLFASALFVIPVQAARTCCTDAGGGNASGDCDGCRAEGRETKNFGDTCAPGANCEVCPSSHPRSNQCGGGSTSKPATCSQSIYALTNPTNMQVGETKNFYADGRATNGIFHRMVAAITNVPSSTPAVGTVATTSGPTCYANGNCRQGFRLTAKAPGTAVLKVTTQVKLCPACGVTGSCSGNITVNVGNVTPRACKPGAACKLTARSLGCTMPTLSSGELAGGTASYQAECTPFKGTVAQAKIARTSANGIFPAITMATGVTNVKCSFRHCVTATTGVTTCSNWGAAS